MSQTHTTRVEARLAESGHAIPDTPKPAADYVPWTRAGATVYVAGQIPVLAGKIQAEGKVGQDLSTEEAQGVAAVCARNAIAVLRDAAAGNGTDLDGVRIVRIGVFVASAPGFTEQHLVANGASGVFAAAFGEPGIHARSAVGVAELPLGVPVEVEVIAELTHLQETRGGAVRPGA